MLLIATFGARQSSPCRLCISILNVDGLNLLFYFTGWVRKSFRKRRKIKIKEKEIDQMIQVKQTVKKWRKKLFVMHKYFDMKISKFWLSFTL